MHKKPESKSLEQEEVGYTQSFVLAKGFTTVDSFDALNGHDDTKRLFAQLSADPDRPDVRPADAYLSMLSSMQPGWIIRVLQIFWPDPLPRQRFFELMQRWPRARHEGTSILLDGLGLAVQGQGLPYTRKTVVEFLHPGTEGTPWWQSLPEICAIHGVQVSYMTREEIEALSYWIFNPNLST
jgi:hypothetical protein